jgi:hypothetical protein
MPKIEDFQKQKPSKKSNGWTVPLPNKEPTTPQRRPGRGEDPFFESPKKDHLELKIDKLSIAPLTSLGESTNATQTVHEGGTNATQTVHEGGTNATQTVHEGGTRKSVTRHKRYTEGDTDRDTNGTRTVHERDTKLSFSKLLGIKRDVVKFVFNQCKFNGNLEGTEYLSYEHLSEATGHKKSSMKTTVSRLREDGYLIRVDRVDGRGGLIRLKLDDPLYKSMIFSETSNSSRENNATQTVHKRYTIRDTEGDTTISSSSSLKEERDPKTTTTAKSELPDDWKEINCAPLRDLREPFGENHLRRLLKIGKTNPIQVQENIKRVAYAIKHKTQTFKKSPIAMLMGLLSEGIDFDAPKGYQSPMIKFKEPEALISSQENEIQNSKSSDELEAAAATEAKRQIAALTAHLKDMP